ncbi:MAG: SagB/ThcOx family dehydrogenase [Canidatus Methanoxibalbensis ujae]|nr:SagB/ThcOx family dehydrogenase [Candidatus Methanoxibalbensis ujae]
MSSTHLSRKKIFIAAVVAASVFYALHQFSQLSMQHVDFEEDAVIQLPEPIYSGNVSVEAAIKSRRSVRSYTDEPLNIHHISQLLWAAQGITDPFRKFRSAPSAGATYPLEVYVAVGNRSVVLGERYLKEGVYHYEPHTHRIERVVDGDVRANLCDAAVGQECVRNAPVDFVICAVYERTTRRYGDRGIRYVHMEAGHSAQNIYLECESLGLATVAIGAFFDDRVREILNTSAEPLYVIPVGHPLRS